jgi:hypothetical protein
LYGFYLWCEISHILKNKIKTIRTRRQETLREKQPETNYLNCILNEYHDHSERRKEKADLSI